MCKAALERFTTGLAQEVYNDGIGVNTISPGLVATPGVVHHKLITKANEDREARLVEFDKEVYRQRNIVERLIGWLKESRRIFSRFEKTAKNFGGMITLAFIRQYLAYELV